MLFVSYFCLDQRDSLFFLPPPSYLFFFFFNDTATTEIYTLSLHDALPISRAPRRPRQPRKPPRPCRWSPGRTLRSEEHTSELQSRLHLVCRLLLEKKKRKSKLTNSIDL